MKITWATFIAIAEQEITEERADRIIEGAVKYVPRFARGLVRDGLDAATPKALIEGLRMLHPPHHEVEIDDGRA